MKIETYNKTKGKRKLTFWHGKLEGKFKQWLRKNPKGRGLR